MIEEERIGATESQGILARPVAAMLLAAGESRRMGEPKGLLPLGSKTVVEVILDKLLSLPLHEIIAVLGHQADRLRGAIGNRAVRAVINSEYPRGMLSSVQFGLKHLSPGAEGVMICLLDQPLIPTEVFRCLVDSLQHDASRILIPTYEGRRGHPILIPLQFCDEVFTLEDSLGLRQLLRAKGEAIREVAVTAKDVLSDLDTKRDYELLKSMNEHGQTAEDHC